VIDLGQRLADVERLGLAAEDVEYGQTVDPRDRLRVYGASEAECRFLVDRPRPGRVRPAGRGQEAVARPAGRAERALMTADRFIAYLEAKLVEHGVTKLLPDGDTLAAAYRRAARIEAVQAAVDAELVKANESAPIPPPDLEARVQDVIRAQPTLSWDAAVAEIAKQEGGDPRG
jgi:hypothetical protein